jgi:hypothetical protein
MIYLKVISGAIIVMCIVYAGFNIMDFLSWWWVKSKSVVVGIFNLIKGLIPK